jgi:hypothetical protein
MKIRSLLALVGLAISFALPTFAQQTNQIQSYVNALSLALRHIQMHSIRMTPLPVSAILHRGRG